MNTEGLPVKPPFRLYYCPIELGYGETFENCLLLPNLYVRLKFQSSKYFIYYCG
jgi:hypothetical protein